MRAQPCSVRSCCVRMRRSVSSRCCCCAVVWATDIGGYFGGRALGGPKLWQRVSPKKTWSGALSGTFVAIVAGLLVSHYGAASSLTCMALVILVLSVVSQAGDLFESSVKRHFDAGIPGSILPRPWRPDGPARRFPGRGRGGGTDRVGAWRPWCAGARPDGVVTPCRPRCELRRTAPTHRRRDEEIAAPRQRARRDRIGWRQHHRSAAPRAGALRG